MIWAGRELGGRPDHAIIRLLPWSATARLSVGGGHYWIKVSPAHNIAIERRILVAAAVRRLPGVPPLIAAEEELNALLLGHVVSQPCQESFAEVIEHKNQLTSSLPSEGLSALSLVGCAEVILSACRGGPWWTDDATARTLAEVLKWYEKELVAGDAALGGAYTVIHGDFHPGNVLSTSAGPVFIDWGDAYYGSPMWDYATFQTASGADILDDFLHLLAGIKGIADFSLTPRPDPSATYSIPLPTIKAQISARAEMLIRLLGRPQPNRRIRLWNT